jgi:hypothetical protein
MSFQALGLTGLSLYPNVPTLISGYTGYGEHGLTGFFYTEDGSDVGGTGLTDIKGSRLINGDLFGVTGTTAKYIPCATQNLGANFDAVDFNMPNIIAPTLTSNFTQAAFSYIGIAGYGVPGTSGVTGISGVVLTDYDYSIDNGTTWNQMSTTSGVTGLYFAPAPNGNSIPFVWNIREDLSQIYNFTIKIRLAAQGTFGSDVPISTGYLITYMYFPKTVTVSSPIATSVLPPEYAGVAGYTLLQNAPKPQQKS